MVMTTMKYVALTVVLIMLGVPEARAERASVAVAKATVVVAKAVGKAVRPVPAASWRGLKWLVAHV